MAMQYQRSIAYTQDDLLALVYRDCLPVSESAASSLRALIPILEVPHLEPSRAAII